MRDAGLSQKAIATALGVSQMQVSRDDSETQLKQNVSVEDKPSSPAPPKPKPATGLDGKTRGTKYVRGNAKVVREAIATALGVPKSTVADAMTRRLNWMKIIQLTISPGHSV